MGFFFTLITLTLLSSLQSLKPTKADQNQHLLLDQIIRDNTLKSYTTDSRTGKLHSINLPSNLSGVKVDTIKLRCGSLQRYGAKIQEFDLSSGVNIRPCNKRVILVRQNLGSNFSSLYYNTYKHSSGSYQLISPVLGLLAYSTSVKGGENSSGTIIQSRIEIPHGKKPITIDFSGTEFLNDTLGLTPLCISFDGDGKILSVLNQTRTNVCVAMRDGHFGLVVETEYSSPFMGKESKWKIVTVSSIGGAMGASLLSLLVIAMFVNAKKKKDKMDELERRAYEEEALRVSMVGHVRAAAADASGTRNLPTIEHYYQYKHPRS